MANTVNCIQTLKQWSKSIKDYFKEGRRLSEEVGPEPSIQQLLVRQFVKGTNNGPDNKKRRVSNGMVNTHLDGKVYTWELIHRIMFGVFAMIGEKNPLGVDVYADER